MIEGQLYNFTTRISYTKIPWHLLNTPYFTTRDKLDLASLGATLINGAEKTDEVEHEAEAHRWSHVLWITSKQDGQEQHLEGR